jgi:Flp pilus assembly protein TadG
MTPMRQRGTTTVEFAIIGTVLMVVVFAVIEFGRALFVINMLTEATRRGARMAAVCPVGDPKAAQVAVFANGGASSSIVPGLTTANVQIQYLDTNGAVIASPGTAAGFSSIRYVRARIVGFSQTLLIPLHVTAVPLSGFSATLPRESLGVYPSVGSTPC